MLFEPVLDRFCEVCPLPVMARAGLEYALAPEWINALFERTARSQYTRELTLASIVDLMAPVVCGVSKSVNASYQSSPDEIGASLTAVYEKLKGIETEVSEALVRESSARLAEVIDAMPGGKRLPLLPHVRVKILDGNCLAASEHRIFELRDVAAGPLPGKTLVVLDPDRMLLGEVFACEDGHAQERSLLDRVLETVSADDLWIADRNFCTAGFLRGIAGRGGFFLIRHHRGMNCEPCGPWKELGLAGDNYVMERPVQITAADGATFVMRLVRLNLGQATRDGDEELALLTNAPAELLEGRLAAALYRHRWKLENAFQHLTTTLRCEINTLGYPKAALFGFCVAVISYNVLALIRAALRSCHGQQAGDDELSMYYLTDAIVGNFRGMAVALPPEVWKKYRGYSAQELADELVGLAGNVELRRFRKANRGPKKPAPPRTKARNKPHVSTKRLLDASKRRKTTP
jgi:hypothetical protein